MIFLLYDVLSIFERMTPQYRLLLLEMRASKDMQMSAWGNHNKERNTV